MTVTIDAPPASVSLLRSTPLAMGLFAVTTGGMVIGGMLPELARGLGVSEPVAGQLMTVYAATTALTGPMLAAMLGRVPRRRLLLMGLTAFVVCNVASMAAPTYTALLVLRILTATAAAVVFPSALTIAGVVARPGQRGRYLALATSGMTMAVVVGVPLGTWLGGAFGWQLTLLFVAGAGLVAVAGAATLPADMSGESVSLAARWALLRDSRLLRTFAATIALTGGAVVFTAYLRPLLRAASGADHRQAATMLGVAGLAGILGAWLGGRVIDRVGAPRVLVVGLCGHAAGMLLCGALAWFGGVPIALTAVALTPVTLFGWMLNPALSARLLELAPAPAAATDAIAVNGSLGQLGAAGAGIVGGLLLAQTHPAMLGVTGAALQLVALALLSIRRAEHIQPATSTRRLP